jgi:hypothetical protein
MSPASIVSSLLAGDISHPPAQIGSFVLAGDLCCPPALTFTAGGCKADTPFTIVLAGANYTYQHANFYVLVQIVFGLANHHFPYSSETSVSHA